jgi:SAM-dependent methyltransferase
MDFSNVRFESARCLCGSLKPPQRAICCRDEFSGLSFRYERCQDCGLDTLNPRPIAADIGQFYPTTYYAYQSNYGEDERIRRWFERLVYQTYYASGAERRWWVTILWPVLAVLLLPIRRWPVLAFAPPSGRHVFELGAAAGSDLLSFRAAGWETSGCEPSRQACEVAAARGFTLQCCTAEEAVLAENTYTCVFMNNVFEHLHNPVGVLRNVKAGLKRNGYLILVVPNHDSWSARWLRGRWAGYVEAPRHIHGYSPRTLRGILGTQGFSIVYIQHRPALRWLWHRTAFTWLSDRGFSVRSCQLLARLFSVVVLPVALLSSLFRRGDFIKVVARKQD